MMSREDRKAQRRAAMENERKKIEEGTKGGFKYKNDFLISEDALAELGMKMYSVVVPEKDKGSAVGEVHFLPANETDCDNNLDITAFPLYYHTGVGPDESNILCPRLMRDYLKERGVAIPKEIASGKCPICEEHDIVLKQFFDEKETTRKEMLQAAAKALRAFSGKWDEQRPKGFLSYVVDAINEAAENEGPKIFILPATFHDRGLVELTLDYKNKNDNGTPGFIDIQDTEKGGYIVFYKNSGDGFDRYHGFRLIDRDYPLEDNWLDVPCWMDCLVFHTYEQIAEMFEGADLSDSDNEPAEEHHSEQPRRRRERSAPEPEPVDEEETVYDDDPVVIPDDEPEAEKVDEIGEQAKAVRNRTRSEPAEARPRRRRTGN